MGLILTSTAPDLGVLWRMHLLEEDATLISTLSSGGSYLVLSTQILIYNNHKLFIKVYCSQKKQKKNHQLNCATSNTSNSKGVNFSQPFSCLIASTLDASNLRCDSWRTLISTSASWCLKVRIFSIMSGGCNKSQLAVISSKSNELFA